jgi:hypothetical protein
MQMPAGVICWANVIVIGAHHRNTHCTESGSASNSACENGAATLSFFLMVPGGNAAAVLGGCWRFQL